MASVVDSDIAVALCGLAAAIAWGVGDFFGARAAKAEDASEAAAAVQLVGEPRAKAYQEIAKYVYDDFGTVPLAQPSFYYGLSQRLDWNLRIDGFMLAKEMKLKE